MPILKKRFDNDGALLDRVGEFVREGLKKEGLPDPNAVNAANLVCSIAAKMAGKRPEFLGVVIRKSPNTVTVRIVSDGPVYNPLEDLDIGALMDSDPPLPDADFDAPLPREQLLKALRSNLSYYCRNKRNEVEFVARKTQPRTLRMVTWAMVLAAVAGLVLRYGCGEVVQTAAADYVLTPIRTMFLNALKMLVVPVVFLSISSSVANVSDIREYGRVGAKVFLLYTITSFLAILVGYGAYQLLQPGNHAALDLAAYRYTPETTGEISVLDTVVNIVPSSFVGAFTGTDMLQIIFLAILVGVAASLMDNGADRQKLSEGLGLLNRLFLKVASIVMKAIPLATFCAMTLLILTIDTGMAAGLVKLVLGMVLGAAGMFAVYSLLLLLSGKNPLVFFKKCAPNFLSFITFCSTSAVMPQSLETCGKRLGISSRISSFSMPLGSTINMDGACVYLTLSILFLAEVYQVPVTADMMLKLAVTIVILSMGAPPIAGAGFICLSVLVQQMGIPMDSLGILMGIDQIMSMCRTLINGTGDLAVTTVVAKSEDMLDDQVYDAP